MTPRGSSTALGASIAGLRRRAGLTQDEVASRAGMSVGGLRDVEQGRVVRPRPRTLHRLAAALELSAAETRELLHLSQQGPVLVDDFQVHVLGPLTVLVHGVPTDTGSARQRTLLGMLALSPGEVVNRDALIEALWESCPPPTAADLLQTYVYRLRQRLRALRCERAGPSLVAKQGGYQLTIADDELDLLAFRRLVDAARQHHENGRTEAAFLTMRRALALWRGEPLADLPAMHMNPTVTSLTLLRQSVAVEYADWAFAIGRHQEPLPLLRSLVETDQLNEAAHYRLMRALWSVGRQATALEVYDLLRRRLADELGIDPGVDLQELHQAILRGDLQQPSRHVTAARVVTEAAPVVPRQLPLDVHAFAGRHDLLARLDDALLAPRSGGRQANLALLVGVAGVGKSSLAAHWATRVASAFPDGQLYVNLSYSDSTDSGVEPSTAVTGFLHALGVPPTHVPATEGERHELYRHLMRDKRALVVVDDAPDTDAVWPLLPGGPGCVVLVTSRLIMVDLVAAVGALPVPVPPLSDTESRAMLAARLGPERLAAEPEAVDAIVETCAGLPAALTMVATRASAHPDFRLRALTDELSDPRVVLDELDAGREWCGLRASFRWSYDRLDEPGRELFRVLGTADAADVTPLQTAALVGIPPARVRVLLTQLISVSLLTEVAPGRYRMHPLVRAFAAEVASGAEGESYGSEALDPYPDAPLQRIGASV